MLETNVLACEMVLTEKPFSTEKNAPDLQIPVDRLSPAQSSGVRVVHRVMEVSPHPEQ